MRTVIFLRHGATAGNLQRRYIGRTDEPLVKLQMDLRLEADYVFVSPMLRTRQTAKLVFPGREVSVIDGLRETDFGIFEGKTAAELWDCPDYRQWVDGGCTGPIPGGEAVVDFKSRCCAAFQTAMERVPEGKTAAFVVHGGCIMSILERFACPKRNFYDYHIENGAFFTCRMEQGVLSLLP